MEINKDLQRERHNCNFNIRELTEFIDGGSQKTLDRKYRERILLTEKEQIYGGVPEHYLSHKEKYEVAVKRGVAMFKLLREIEKGSSINLVNYKYHLANLLRTCMVYDGSPLILHYIMFVTTILSQADEDQQAKWLNKAWEGRMIGSFAQTELGHGTFIRGLETTATYDPETEEFVINTPTLTSFKWWGGGLGQTANYCVVIAQLYTKGKCHGIHLFMVQVRDEQTHEPLPGIKIGEIGSKMGLNAVNNGFLGLDNVRIPRRHMLMKHAQVLQDGTYVKSVNFKLNYGTLLFVRMIIVKDTINYGAKAVTVAIRYSAVRRQSQLKAGEPELQILDFMTQQHKLFIVIATCHAYHIAASKLEQTFDEVNEQLGTGNMERLPELHALACCLKAVGTAEVALHIEKCRLACGGHGYMHSSNLPQLYAISTASCTFEGDNTVLLLQTARFLVHTWRKIDTCTLTPTVTYLKAASADGFMKKWENSIEGLIHAFQYVAMRKVESCVENMTKRVMSGLSQEDAWNLTSVQLVAAAEAHCRVVIVSSFYEKILLESVSMSGPLRNVMNQLVELYAVYWALENLKDLLMYTLISKNDVDELQLWYEQLLTKIRPNAVGLVDAFDISDEFLQSAIGAYDGRVYERLMEDALKSPLNAEPVNKSFHEYLKPFMQGKL